MLQSLTQLGTALIVNNPCCICSIMNKLNVHTGLATTTALLDMKQACPDVHTSGAYTMPYGTPCTAQFTMYRVLIV